LASSGAVFDLALSIFILPVWAFLLKSRQAVLFNEGKKPVNSFWFLVFETFQTFENARPPSIIRKAKRPRSRADEEQGNEAPSNPCGSLLWSISSASGR
jgi:hypothetical protein